MKVKVAVAVIGIGIVASIISYFLFVNRTHKESSSNYSSTTTTTTGSINDISPVPAVTIQPTSSVSNDNVHTLEDTYNKVNQPDIFLSNRTPYETTDFSVTSTFTQTPNEHFYFSIVAKIADGQKVRQEVVAWLHSVGLQDSDIAALDIRYQ